MIKNVKLKVVGVSFTNEDGTNRQAIIEQMTANSTVTIRREPANRYDRNAIAVHTEMGQVGYIGKDYASIMAPMMDAGTQFSATVAEVGNYKNTNYLHIMINEVESGSACTAGDNIYADYDDMVKDSTKLSGGHLW